MTKVNLLKSISKIKRNTNQRSKKTKIHIKISKKFGKDYFDGKREYALDRSTAIQGAGVLS